MSKGIFRRYLWLVDTIRHAKDGITFEQINRKWKGFFKLNLDGSDLPKKTFHNWLNSLPEEMGVEVECTKNYPYGKNGACPPSLRVKEQCWKC